MRKQVQKQIIEIFQTILEGVNYAVTSQSQQVGVVLSDCFTTFNFISDNLEAGLSDERFNFYHTFIVELQSLLETIYGKISLGQPVDEIADKFRILLQKLETELTQEPEVKIEVVFMPYKSSMWDSLESIWLAANNDERCNAVVVPIPYYDRNPDRTVAAIHYEGRQFPDNVPIVHYDDYDLSKTLPDIIYIHNPYDDANRVTSVDPRFYSYNLKHYTNMLVYVPYFTSGAYKDIPSFAQKHLTSCVNSVDKIVVQSSTHKQLYVECGVDEKKLLVLGSPKMDAVANLDINHVNVPEAWEAKLKGKKSIVLNSTLGPFLNDPQYLEKLKERVSTILSFDELTLIWRPHPLLETTVTSMKPNLYKDYKEVLHMLESHENVIVDLSANTEAATMVTDGMISDLSSWARQYIATEKPVLILNGKSELRKERTCVFDHFSCYFFYDGCSIEEFCKMVINEVDKLKDERINDLRNSLVNIDGTCGQKINEHVVSLVG
ncbi:CDP-glycerol glycerophosphotransferase family protein [Paenibacillus solani]|uniref:CDP-glycerol glycerophosphotransferase family protein n=1 Tax=Paenibacillus solani TaxID=1705565 RepID=UPI003D2DC39E